MRLDLQDVRIGYVPYSPNLTSPADTRRFCYYAKQRNISFEIATPTQHYDLVILSESCDLSVWSAYERSHSKIIYELLDAYLSIPMTNLKALLRGVAKFIAGQSRHLRLNYRRAIEDMCRRADAVICNTDEQAEIVGKLCPNVHLILDIHNTYRDVKTDYAAGEVFNLVWEGFPENIASFDTIRPVLKRLDAKHPLALHLVTRSEHKRFLGKFLTRKTSDLYRDLLQRIYLNEWTESTCSRLITACDLALIPIDLNDPLAAGKSENKLLIFWRMGMPTIVSSTPAYSRAMRRAGIAMDCRTPTDWENTLERYIADSAARERDARLGRNWVRNHHSDESVLRQWDSLLESVLMSSPRI